MRILTGDETGLFKWVLYEEQKIVNTFGTQEKGNGIDFFTFFDKESEKSIISLSKRNILSLFETKDKANNFENIVNLNLKYIFKNAGMHLLNNKKIILSNKQGEIFSTQINDELEEFDKEKLLYKTNFELINFTKLNDFDQKCLMILSKDTNPQIYDIESNKISWKARNVKNDYLDLKVPINDLDCAFHSNNKNSYVSTAYNKIRVYDIKKSNSQPIIDFNPKHEDSPFNKIIFSHCENYIFVSNLLGSIFKFDLRKNLDIIAKFKGSTGSIENICLHPTLPYLGVVGLDRYLRFYNLNINKLTYKCFMKQKLSTCIFSKELISNEIVVSDEEDFELIQNLNKKENTKEIKDKLKNLKKHRIPLNYTNQKINKQESSELEEKIEKKIKK